MKLRQAQADVVGPPWNSCVSSRWTRAICLVARWLLSGLPPPALFATQPRHEPLALPWTNIKMMTATKSYDLSFRFHSHYDAWLLQ